MHSSFARIARLVDLLRDGGGVMRSRQVHDRGVSAHIVQKALDEGAAIRPLRGWLALPDADPELLAAARAGVVLSCITQARRLGLWVLTEPEPHVAATAPSATVRVTRAHVHWAVPPIRRTPGILVDPVENVLALVAGCQEHDIALAIWESALRRGAVARESLQRLPLGPAGRRLCAEAVPWSDSGLESFVAPRLRWTGVPIVPQVWLHGHRVDFLIGDRLALQIDGGHHVGAQRSEDIAHDASLRLLGYTVIRVSYPQVVHRWHEVHDLVLRALAQGLHRAAPRRR